MRYFLLAAGMALAAAPAGAVITVGAVTGGSVVLQGGVFQQIAPPPPTTIAINGFDSWNLIGFNEKQNYVLTVNQAVTIGASPVPKGTIVSSHYFVFDPPSGAPTGTRTVQGYVSFNQPVRGVIATTSRLNQSNYLGVPGVTYGPVSGWEPASDSIWFFGKTVYFNLASGANNADMFRVLTIVPEPATWAMLIAGFGLVGLASRRRRAIISA